MLGRTGRFRRSQRVRLTKDYRRISRAGSRVATRDFVFLLAPTWRPSAARGSRSVRSRVGITVSRRVGGAVVRNYVKRSIREWFRAQRWRIEMAVDVVVIARPIAAKRSGREIARILSSTLEREEVRAVMLRLANRVVE